MPGFTPLNSSQRPEPQPRKRRRLLSGLDSRNILEPSDIENEDVLSHGSDSPGFPVTQRPNTRARLHGPSFVGYNMKYHPLDDYVGRRRINSESPSLSDTSSPSSLRVDMQGEEESTSGQRLPVQGVRRSSRKSINKDAVYSTKIHPQDQELRELERAERSLGRKRKDTMHTRRVDEAMQPQKRRRTLPVIIADDSASEAEEVTLQTQIESVSSPDVESPPALTHTNHHQSLEEDDLPAEIDSCSISDSPTSALTAAGGETTALSFTKEDDGPSLDFELDDLDDLFLFAGVPAGPRPIIVGESTLDVWSVENDANPVAHVTITSGTSFLSTDAAIPESSYQLYSEGVPIITAAGIASSVMDPVSLFHTQIDEILRQEQLMWLEPAPEEQEDLDLASVQVETGLDDIPDSAQPPTRSQLRKIAESTFRILEDTEETSVNNTTPCKSILSDADDYPKENTPVTSSAQSAEECEDRWRAALAANQRTILGLQAYPLPESEGEAFNADLIQVATASVWSQRPVRNVLPFSSLQTEMRRRPTLRW